VTTGPGPVGPYRVRDLTGDDLIEIEGWRYEGPWAVYDSEGRLDPGLGYWAVEGGDGRLAGFGCLGADARVPGLGDADGVVDVGVGMRPDLVGRGGGVPFAAAFLDFAAGRVAADRFRVVVKDWNGRSLRLVQRLGFAPTGSHAVQRDGLTETYVVLERPVRPG
jgi:ribosomal-protein-alanine N-acetyltransferase